VNRLDHDPFARLQLGAMHLPDRRRSHRLILEVVEDFLDRPAEFRFDQLANHFRRVGGRVGLQGLQFLGQRDADQVGPGA
jgi:hypothetical protein